MQNPEPKNRTARRQDWMDARTTRDFAVVERLGSAILSRVEDETIRRGLARLMAELGRNEESLEHWKRLRDRSSDDFEAVFHVARSLLDEGVSANDAIQLASPQSSQAMIHNLRGVLERDREQVLDERIRHIALCGTSYCGSTLMDRLLGGLPGVRSIGESHWLIKARYNDGYGLANFSREISPKMVPCTVCGDGCPVLTLKFRREMAADHTNWYLRIARQLDTRILISADKNTPKLVENDPMLRLDALVLFKSPVQAWVSTLDKLPRDRDPDYYLSECQNYLTVWTRSYQTFLDRFSPQGRVVFLCFDTFTQRPEEIFASLCETLSLPFDSNTLRMTVPGHAIGGNSRALKKLRDRNYAVEITPLAYVKLPAEHLNIIEKHAEAQHLYAEMKSAFRTAIPA